MWQEDREPIDRRGVLRACPMLREFTEVGLRVLAESCEERFVGRGTFAFRGGEPSMGLAIVARGTLHLVPRDGGAPMGELTAGDTLGGLSLLQPGEHLVTGFAHTDVELLVLPPAAFARIEKTHPRAALKLRLAVSNDLAERLRQAKAPLREFLVWQISRRQG